LSCYLSMVFVNVSVIDIRVQLTWLFLLEWRMFYDHENNIKKIK
jgi:hypothetical protein